MSHGPLNTLIEAIKTNVHSLGSLSGCAHLILRDGKCVFASADGLSDKEQGIKFSLDTLMPLHGATKPLVVAAFLTLVDEGRLKLSDPVEKYIDFPDASMLGSNGRTKKLPTKPTLMNLLCMTAGVGYDDCPTYQTVMRRIARGTISDLTGMCDAIGAEPLQFEPGKRYHYSFSADVIGRICEKVSGLRIDKFMEQRLLKPLGMKDTHFEQVIPKTKQKRLAVLYRSQQVRDLPKFRLKPLVCTSSAPGIFSCGGGVLSYRDYGMVSSVRDYSRFCEMLLKDGLAADGKKRILKESTMKAVWRDGLTPWQREDGRLPGWNDSAGLTGMTPCQAKKFWDQTGWSALNTHLCFKESPRRVPARTGHTMWMGGGGGAFWSIDKKRKLVSLSFAPCLGGRACDDDGLGPLANDASIFAVQAVDEAKAAKRRKSA